ncbi:laccase-14-like [Rutidosis leptorrhynchoides]|uniref:laccase-14-like n=1 Tax=Rutidosis leptorrhynchoides TaxID=125765 RepID=UPI003A999238
MKITMNIHASLLGLLAILSFLQSQAALVRYTFVVQETKYTRLCSSKNILTVNGQYPGPTISARKGDTIIVDVVNNATQNITIHWHGVKQPRYPWSDGPEFITQCPIKPGTSFSQKIILSTEEGTLWWHAHSDWSRATVHGLLVVSPKIGTTFPFPKPHAEVPVILGEWWKQDIQTVMEDFLRLGGDPNKSDALTINGQPGDQYNCSRPDTTRITVKKGKTYMLRMVNAAMNNVMFFAIKDHQLTVVGTDGAYTKPLKSNYVTISPGQTIDVILKANKPKNHYYMAAKFYSSNPSSLFDNATTTAIIQYNGNYTKPTSLVLPVLPVFNDSNASANFTRRLRSLASNDHPIDVPLTIKRKLLYTLSLNLLPCDSGKPNATCVGPLGRRFAASINNMTFDLPKTSILTSYYRGMNGVYGDDFPDKPSFTFNYTSNSLDASVLDPPMNGTKVKVLNYNDTVEIVFQGTNILLGIDHPMHLHGYSFYVVGSGFGNFDRQRDPLNYNLVDPPLQQTIAVPRDGWTAIRFRANNPGVWFMHCHFERHISWGMKMVFIVKNGKTKNTRILPPPPDMPKC